MVFEWNEEKNNKLIIERGISFDEIVVAIDAGCLVRTEQNKPPYTHQRVYYVWINSYMYLVPFIYNKEKIFLKTIIPNSKETRLYLMNIKKYEKNNTR